MRWVWRWYGVRPIPHIKTKLSISIHEQFFSVAFPPFYFFTGFLFCYSDQKCSKFKASEQSLILVILLKLWPKCFEITKRKTFCRIGPRTARKFAHQYFFWKLNSIFSIIGVVVVVFNINNILLLHPSFGRLDSGKRHGMNPKDEN